MATKTLSKSKVQIDDLVDINEERDRYRYIICVFFFYDEEVLLVLMMIMMMMTTVMTLIMMMNDATRDDIVSL